MPTLTYSSRLEVSCFGQGFLYFVLVRSKGSGKTGHKYAGLSDSLLIANHECNNTKVLCTGPCKC